MPTMSIEGNNPVEPVRAIAGTRPENGSLSVTKTTGNRSPGRGGASGASIRTTSMTNGLPTDFDSNRYLSEPSRVTGPSAVTPSGSPLVAEPGSWAVAEPNSVVHAQAAMIVAASVVVRREARRLAIMDSPVVARGQERRNVIA